MSHIGAAVADAAGVGSAREQIIARCHSGGMCVREARQGAIRALQSPPTSQVHVATPPPLPLHAHLDIHTRNPRPSPLLRARIAHLVRDDSSRALRKHVHQMPRSVSMRGARCSPLPSRCCSTRIRRYFMPSLSPPSPSFTPLTPLPPCCCYTQIRGYLCALSQRLPLPLSIPPLSLSLCVHEPSNILRV